MTKKIKGTALILNLCCHVGNLEHLIQVLIPERASTACD